MSRIEDASLDFPSDGCWERDKWLISGKESIFVRPCYEDLFSLCQLTWETHQGVFLKGTPGVGKSYYLDYTMDRLLKTDARVLLLSGPQKQAWLCQGYGKQIEQTSLQTALDDCWASKSDFVLYDPHENPLATQDLALEAFGGKKFLIAMSPDPQNCAKIVKDAEETETFFMGPTTKAESEKMRLCCYSARVTHEQLCRRFNHGGGIPRFLFKAPGSAPRAEAQDSVLQTIAERQAFALNDLVQNARRIDGGSVASEYKSLWALYHLVPDKYYTSYTVELCCENAVALLRQRLLEKSVTELWNLFNTTDERHGTLRGIRFESYAHKKILLEGISQSAKKLNKNGVADTGITIDVPASSAKVYLLDNDTSKLETQAKSAARQGGAYLLPWHPNYPVIDAAFVGPDGSCTMLQMKAGKSKPLSTNHVSTVCAALGDIFVVVTPSENIVTKKLVGAPDNVRQFNLVLREDGYRE